MHVSQALSGVASRVRCCPVLRSERFLTLDGMRGLAALIVAASHINEMLGLGALPHAHLAVDFFFVLSGFVIAQAYEARLRSSLAPLEFIRLRVIRLHLLILLGSGITLTILLARSLGGQVLSVSAILWTAATGIFLIPYHQIPAAEAFPLDGPIWSLFAEYAVNIAFAFIAPSLTPARLRIVLAVGIGMLLILFGFNGGVGDLWRTETIGLSLLRVVYPFFAGVFLNRLYRERHVPWPTISPFVSIMALLAILGAPSTFLDGPFEFAMITLAFPLLIFASTGDNLAPTQRKLMSLSGRLSYPIYILHFPLALLLGPTMGFIRPGSNASVVLMMIFVVATSYLALRFLDEPLRDWLRSNLHWPRVRQLAQSRRSASISDCGSIR
jgi:peptidoglycan/LPS O-acetylase OafA/YrhL